MRTLLLGLAERALKPPAAVPALTMRANSEGEKYNAPAALPCKMLLILKALLHPDTHAATSAFLTHKQGSVDVIAYLSDMERLSRYVRDLSTLVDRSAELKAR